MYLRNGRTIRGVLLALSITPCVHAALPAVQKVVSAASFKPNLAWGALSTIFGTDLGSVASATSLPLPLQLGGAQLYVCNQKYLGPDCVRAGLIYVGPSQINFLMPNVTKPVAEYNGTDWNTSFWVSVNGRESASIVQQVNPTAVGVFTMGYMCPIGFDGKPTACPDAWDTKYGTNYSKVIRAAITDSTGRLVTAENPIHRSGYYTLWLTGSGSYGTPNTNTAYIASDVHITLNQEHAPLEQFILFAGPSPQFPGLGQVNFSVSEIPPCGPYVAQEFIAYVRAFNSYDFRFSFDTMSLPIVCK